jgi:hypothetical protein
MPEAQDGTRVRATILGMIDDQKNAGRSDDAFVKLRIRIGDSAVEDIITYNEIADFIEDDESFTGQQLWKFKNILAHKKVSRSSPDYRGSSWNVLVEWEDGSKTWEPLYTKNPELGGIWHTDRVTVAIYARENGLVGEAGWNLPGMKSMTKNQKKFDRTVKQAKLHSFRTKPMYMFGFQVPRNHEQAMELDRKNGNTRWRDAENIELGQLDEYSTFDDKGKGYQPGSEYKRINVHLVYAVKHDGRHKARCVAGGHLTDTPIDSVYSSVVSLRGIRLLTFLAELNGQETWVTDIGNAYLETFTQEKVYIIAGPEFGDRVGHTLIILKALYGLKSSGKRWHERLSDVLLDMGFERSKAEPDIWMREKDGLYEYIGVYVDDLMIVSKEPKLIVASLKDDHKFKLKGSGAVTFHLGCDYFRDEDGVLCYAPKKYIEQMMDTYFRNYGKLPKEYSSPLEHGDHPELDDSELLDMEQTQLYQSLIGQMQWIIQLGRMDITTHVMTLSRFRAAPREGHLKRVHRIYGWLRKHKGATIRIRTDLPDYSDLPDHDFDWSYSCYNGAKEDIPSDAPEPLGKPVVTTSYYDANLLHDLISGRSVTGIIHFLNKTPVDWFSKLQSTVATATFGSEYVASRTCVEQIVDLRLTLRYLGVPLKGPSYMFGDNESVVNTGSRPDAKLTKRHYLLSYHKTREAVAAGYLRCFKIDGTSNPADIVSKHWSFPTVWNILKPLLFWRGDTASIPEKKKTAGGN